jgi:competence protein ComEC
VHRRTDVALGYGLHPQEAAVVRGMVLGDRSLIPEALEEAFQRSGITHSRPMSGRRVLGSPPAQSSSRTQPTPVAG